MGDEMGYVPVLLRVYYLVTAVFAKGYKENMKMWEMWKCENALV